MRQKYFWPVLFAPWVILAGLSIYKYIQAAGRGCFFQTNWLGCAATLSRAEQAIMFFFITALFILFIIGAVWSWGYLTQPLLIPKKYLVAALAALGFLAASVVPFGSSDTSYYYFSGRAFAEGRNLYIENWEMQKPFVYPVPTNTINSFSYGPVIAPLFKYLYIFSQGNVLLFIFGWKFLTLVVFGATGLLTIKLVRLFAPATPATGVAIVWFTQPLLLFEWLTNGHFDVVWLLCVVAAMVAAKKNIWWAVAPLLILGTWIKFIPILMTPIFALWWWQTVTKNNWWKKVLEQGIGLLLTALLTVFIWFPYWTGPQVFTSLVIQSKWAVISWFAVIYYSLKPLFVAVFAGGAHWWLTRLVHLILLMALVALSWPLIVRSIRVLLKRDRWSASNYILLLYIFLLTYLFIWQKSLWPWYTAWLLPIGLVAYAATNNNQILRLARWVTIAPLTFYSIWLVGWLVFGQDGGNELWFYWLMVLITTGLPLYILARERVFGSEFEKNSYVETQPESGR